MVQGARGGGPASQLVHTQELRETQESPDLVKRQLRACLRKERDQIPVGLRDLYSSRILSRLQHHPLFKQSRFPALTVSFGSEVNTLPLLEELERQGLPFAIPRVNAEWGLDFYHPLVSIHTLTPSSFGILEPDPSRDTRIPPEDIDLFVVPGLGFDPRGHRLGHGKGCFDRYLAHVPPSTPRVALAFECQIVENLPQDLHDQLVDLVLTERTAYRVQEEEWTSHSVDETHQTAARVAASLSPPVVIRLSGELGAGKSEWVRGFVHSLGWQGRVRSPTFSLEHVYDTGKERIYHLDGYRLTSPSLLDLSRLEEIMEEPGSVVLIEWPERFGEELSPFSPLLHFERLDETSRRITWRAFEENHHL